MRPAARAALVILLLDPWLAAQSRPATRSAADAQRALAAATLARQVDGDSDAARTALIAALSQMDATELGVILRALGREAGAQGVPGQGERAASRPGDPMDDVLGALDRGDGHAYALLKNLGPLAVPALTARLDRLGVVGLKSACELLAGYTDTTVVAAFERLVRSPDVVRQQAAMSQLFYLPNEARSRLAELALASASVDVRLAGLKQLARDPARRDRVVEIATQWAADQDGDLRAKAASVFNRESLRGHPGALALLDRLRADPDPRVAWAATWAWLDCVPDDAEDAVLAGLDRRPASLSETVYLDRALASRRSESNGDLSAFWPRVQSRALRYPESDVGRQPERLFDAFRSRGLVPEPEDLVAFTRRDPLWSGDAFGWLAQLRSPAGIDLALELTANPKFAGAAISYLSRVQPDALVAKAPLLFDQHPDVNYRELIEFLAERGNEQSAGAAIGYWLAERSWSDVSLPSALGRLIAYRSDGSNLKTILRLARAPIKASNDGERSALQAGACAALQRWFAREHVGAALPEVPQLDNKVAEVLLQRVAAVVTDAELDAVQNALDRALSAAAGPGRPCDGVADAMCAVRIVRFLVPALGRAGGARAAPALVRLLEHADGPTVEAAWKAVVAIEGADLDAVARRVIESRALAGLLPRVLFDLPRIAASAGLEPLVAARLLEWDGDDMAIARWLSALPPQRRQELSRAIVARFAPRANRNGRICLAAMSAAAAGTADPLPVLALALQANDSEVRRAAIRMIGARFDPEAARHLVEALKDPDSSVVAEARQMLDRLRVYLEEKAKWASFLDSAPASRPPGAGK